MSKKKKKKGLSERCHKHIYGVSSQTAKPVPIGCQKALGNNLELGNPLFRMLFEEMIHSKQ
jgi:hypothetical protein